MFSIEINSNIISTYNKNVFVGKIVIDDFSESFHSSTNLWSIENYYDSWKKSFFNRSNKYGNILLTSVCDPEETNYFRAYIFFSEGKNIIFQEKLIFNDDDDLLYNIIKGQTILPEILTRYDDDNNKISTWDILFDKVEYFFINFTY